jgi:hypothetical protein
MKLPLETRDQLENFVEEFRIEDVGLSDTNIGAFGNKIVVYDLEYSGRNECLPTPKSRFANWFPGF